MVNVIVLIVVLFTCEIKYLNLMVSAEPVCKMLEVDLKIVMWWFDDRETPVLIPNTEVKPISTDGTWIYSWESR